MGKVKTEFKWFTVPQYRKEEKSIYPDKKLM